MSSTFPIPASEIFRMILTERLLRAFYKDQLQLTEIDTIESIKFSYNLENYGFRG